MYLRVRMLVSFNPVKMTLFSFFFYFFVRLLVTCLSENPGFPASSEPH